MFSFNIYMRICKEKKGPEVDRHIKLYLFFTCKNFAPTPVTFEIKIKEVLNPFFGTFHGMWRAKSAQWA